jgi:hypothetical protein
VLGFFVFVVVGSCKFLHLWCFSTTHNSSELFFSSKYLNKLKCNSCKFLFIANYHAYSFIFTELVCFISKIGLL